MEVRLYTQHSPAPSIIGDADEAKIESEIPIQDTWLLSEKCPNLLIATPGKITQVHAG